MKALDGSLGLGLNSSVLHLMLDERKGSSGGPHTVLYPCFGFSVLLDGDQLATM
jgi:hypothetical protein